MSRTTKTLGILTTGLAFAAVLLAVTGASAQTTTSSEDWNKIVAAGKAEGKVVYYTAHVGNPLQKAILQAFTTRYGIAVESLEARASELRERTRVEQAAGRFIADVSFTSDGQAAVIDKEDGVFARHALTPNAKDVRAPFKANDLFAPSMILNYGVLINTSLVKPQDEPKSWADLADPKWKGRILSDDTRAIGGGYLWFYTTMFLGLGEKYQQAMAAQEPVFTRDQREAGRRVARGEFAMFIPFIFPDVNNLKGLPVKVLPMAEGAPYVLYGAVLMRNAPRPNAALLLIDFMMSEEAQLIWARGGHGFVRNGIEEKVPAELRAYANPKLLGTTDWRRQDEGLAAAKRLYK
ncbi:extracellular solute-binding protein [Roseiarcaceae bacterium H3SJ34-1]|uniref:ABC transporter substrate-binding protein n=1 Tax=Terripilifer ovatus TaxID=3032367 RepID=UPI003AB99619|nr:extracellular solute-binding protein [Roseiarcaceae bacterium H3SJ34-1]